MELEAEGSASRSMWLFDLTFRSGNEKKLLSDSACTAEPSEQLFFHTQ
jgi:hypothetical protein